MNSLPEQQQQQQLVEQQEEGKEKEHSQQQPPQQEPPQQQQQEQEQQQSIVVIPETSDIKRLDDATVRRITAEQAISDLASIVKELIDNSLDAESTTIKSKLVSFKVSNVLTHVLTTSKQVTVTCVSIELKLKLKLKLKLN